ncbi:MAG: hypothetical protein QOD99_835 [Chthoniobacter sp.]|nr:hypothetical protein [Chthoniobacter sp.]
MWNRTLRQKVLQRTVALGESEQRFGRLVELMPVAVYVCDTGGIIRSYNKRAVELWGREPVLGDTAQRYCASLRLWSPDGNLVPHEKSKMAEVLRTGVEARNLEVVIERPDESCITVLVNIAPLRNIKGELMGAMNCFQDITQRKQAQEALRESETRFRQVAENISEVFWLANPEATLIHYVSPAYAKIWGRSCDSLYAEPSSWMDSIHPDDRERIAKGVRLQLVRGQHDHTYRIVRPDGSHRWIRDRAFPVSDESGKLIRVAGLAEDITERKEAEDRLREYEKVVEGLEEMIVVVDRDYRYLLANRAFLKYRGMEREQLVGRLVAEVLNEAVFENVTKRKLDECLHGEPVQYEMTYRYPDRGERDLLISYFPIEGPAGVDRVACVLQDITERNRAAKELEEANHRLRILSRRLFEVQEQERRHLARELHDEIGQTLTAAKLNLKIIAPDVPPAFARRLEDSTQLLDRLLMQVRQLSLDLRPPMLDELGLVPTLRWLVDQQAQRAGLRVTFTANVERMEMDPLTRTACFRLAQEAITNAIRHAQAATVAVELRAEPHRLWLVVHDDGVGFDKDAMQQRAARGGSIGLLSMNERVSLLGGEMEVSSAPGRGTEIRAWFPTAPPGPSFATEPL